MTFDEFVHYYRKTGRCPNDISLRKRDLRPEELERRYQKYLESEEKRKQAHERYAENMKSKKMEVDTEWVQLQEDVRKRDGYRCRLLSRLDNASVAQIKEKSYGFHRVLDCAHVFGRGSYPHMKYERDNVVLLNRYSHSCLDQSRDPVTGNLISSELVQKWWSMIVGPDKYKELESKARGV